MMRRPSGCRRRYGNGIVEEPKLHKRTQTFLDKHCTIILNTIGETVKIEGTKPFEEHRGTPPPRRDAALTWYTETQKQTHSSRPNHIEKKPNEAKYPAPLLCLRFLFAYDSAPRPMFRSSAVHAPRCSRRAVG